MQTLSYGFQLPQTSDKGSPLFQALAGNITQLNSHNHDGVNSAPINPIAIKAVQAQILASNWASYGGPIGDYRQLITMSSGFTFDDHTMSFRTSLGEYVYPKVVKVTPTTFYIYSNDPTLNLSVNYGG